MIVCVVGPLYFGGFKVFCCIIGGSIVFLVGPKFFEVFLVGHSA
jgi:hypothetical protein